MAARSSAAGDSGGRDGGNAPRKFSEKLTGMKFMQRSEEAKLRANLEKEQSRKLREWQWVAEEQKKKEEDDEDDDEEDDDAANDSDGECADEPPPAFLGRRSFGHFNVKIETAVEDAKRHHKGTGRASEADTKKRKLPAKEASDLVELAKRQKRSSDELVPTATKPQGKATFVRPK